MRVPGGGKKESLMRKLVMVGLVLGLAWAMTARAGEETKQRPTVAAGAFVSAELAGDIVKWTLDLGGDAGKKVFELTADVKVQYIEKEGVKQAQGIRAAAGRDFRELEGAVVAKGKFASAKLDGEKVLVTITPAEGDKALEVTFPKQIAAMYRTGEDGKITVLGVGLPRAPRAPKGEAK